MKIKHLQHLTGLEWGPLTTTALLIVMAMVAYYQAVFPSHARGVHQNHGGHVPVSPVLPACATVSYLALVLIGKRMMRNRPAFKPTGAMVLYNVCL